MPISDNISVPYISMILQAMAPASVLDVGVGMGKFGFMYREALEWSRVATEGVRCVAKERWEHQLDGIEVCSDYITPVQQYLYDRIHIGSAEDVLKHVAGYDLVYFGDVLEHFPAETAHRVLDAAFAKARLGFVVVTPAGECEQSGVPGNPYEEHKSAWTPKDFSRFPYVWYRNPAKRQWVICVTHEPVWLYDPLRHRKTPQQIQRAERRKQMAKSAIRTLGGDRMVEVIRRLNRWREGWRKPK